MFVPGLSDWPHDREDPSRVHFASSAPSRMLARELKEAFPDPLSTEEEHALKSCSASFLQHRLNPGGANRLRITVQEVSAPSAPNP